MLLRLTLAVTVENAEQQWPSDRKVFATAHADVECFKCHKKGHMYKDCRNRSYVRPRGGSNQRPLEQSGWTTGRGRGRDPTARYGRARTTPPMSSESRDMRDRNPQKNSDNPNGGGPVSRPQHPARLRGGSHGEIE
jgi:hypothetical protein